MKNSKDLLSSVLKTTQMGQVGIRSVLKTQLRPDLESALKDQLKEYDAIEKEALSIASSRAWEPEQLDPGIRFMTDMMTRARFGIGRNDSKIAAMMIHGNTRGMIKALKNLHNYTHSDQRIEAITQKLLTCEIDNIRQMQGFV